MKRGGRLARKTPLTNRTPLSRGSGLTRVPLARSRHLPGSSGGFPRTSRTLSSTRPPVTAAERRARKAVRERSGGRCEACGREPAVEQHHRQNRSQGGAWAAENLLHLDRACHLRATVNPALARSRGWSVRSTDDPARIPVWLAGQGWHLLTAEGGTQPLNERGVA